MQTPGRRIKDARRRAFAAVGVAAAALAWVLLAAVGCGPTSPAETTASTTTTAPTTTSTTAAPTTTSTTEPPPPVYWPLTGLPAPDEASIRARVVSVKIENSTAARPQSNLDRADVVYETITEGGITRFNALYHSAAPTVVGPVRSARLSDLYVVPQYSALFAHVGGNTQVRAKVRASGIEDLDQFNDSSAYWRSKEHRAPHNVFTDIEQLRALALSRGFDAERDIQGLQFDDGTLDDPWGRFPGVTRVVVPLSSSTVVEWTYDPPDRAYLRTHGGKVHSDAVSKEQYRADNVVVMWAKTIAQDKTDSAGSTTYDIRLEGSGKAALFREGRRIDGLWEATRQSPPVLRMEDGTPILLGSGTTWFEVVSTSTDITAE